MDQFEATHVRELRQRATSAGYHLVRNSTPPYSWRLLDAEDGEQMFSSAVLDQVRQWLDS